MGQKIYGSLKVALNLITFSYFFNKFRENIVSTIYWSSSNFLTTKNLARSSIFIITTLSINLGGTYITYPSYMFISCPQEEWDYRRRGGSWLLDLSQLLLVNQYESYKMWRTYLDANGMDLLIPFVCLW